MGGTSATLAATSIPEIFHHVILVDPAMAPFEDLHLQLPNYVYSAIRRRDQWESAEAAFGKFTASQGPLSLWDPHTLNLYVKYALESTQSTKLKCNKLHEASCATDAHSHTFQAYHRLFGYYQNGQQPPFNLSLILAKPSQSISKEVPKQQLSLYKDGKEINFSSWGHLMVQENPAGVASFVSKSLLKSIPSSSCKVKFNNLPSKL
jgi:pimeloyl-ACP methyl ester carboxylesterase